MMDDAARYRANLQDEIDSAYLYRVLASLEAQSQLAAVYQHIAEVEDQHGAFWEAKLRASGQAIPPHQPTWRAKTLAFIARRFGVQSVLPTLATQESQGSHQYDGQPEVNGTPMAAQERSHERLLKTINGGVSGGTLARLEGRHRAVAGNALRAAVLGANDGLLSNFSLIMGVAGADQSGRSILIAGLAGLMAGAGSMALGEWISVQSSRELYHHQISIEKQELEQIPGEEEEELKLIYQAKGLREDEAKLAHDLITDEFRRWTRSRARNWASIPKNWADRPGKRPSPRFSYSPWGRSSRWHPSPCSMAQRRSWSA